MSKETWYFIYGLITSMVLGGVLRYSFGLQLVDKKTGQVWMS
jgi:hypothetical protein